ncbi:alkaline phosphatase family protein [Halodesulfovibrio aestuarii]|uniref:Alkaline phosphatase family protein n=1 Tax=Halodesulfovibrio aestuarii TaxID=126333 RepID=A0A8G2FB52_9BACT|nr:alkaline phosphatase family protein [Halodesulfovibrio aestuarii]SHJ25236.1 Type I phosphodiesterase / nucleotide pyrophosphatase [Halodesulfovibrio aestuarii]
MTSEAKRIALLGFDCAIPKRLEALMEEGALPNFKKFKEEGSYMTEGYNMPTVTPPSWASICTGAYPRTHGVEDYYYYNEGESLHFSKCVQAFGSKMLKAETIWDAWDKAGKKCLVVNYPTSWPSKLKNGVMVQGEGLSAAESRWQIEGYEHRESLCSESCVATDYYPIGVQARFEEAEGWKNLPEEIEDLEPLDMVIPMEFPHAMEKMTPQTWYGLTWESEDDGYDVFALCPEKDFSKAFFTIKVREWSDVIESEFPIESDGRIEKGYFRCKLMELSDDAEDFKLYMSGITGTHGYCAPDDALKNVDFSKTILANDMGFVGLVNGIIDDETVIELAQFHSEWLTEVLTTLMKDHADWDLVYMHTHLIDWFYHGYLEKMEYGSEEEKKKAYDMERAIYQIEDKFLGAVMEHMPADALTCLISDHGATPIGPILNTAEALKQAGLCAYEARGKDDAGSVWEEAEGFNYDLIPEKSLAVPQRYMFVYVNLKSKYPGGIVEDEDYEKVRNQIIDALYDYKHPETGERPVMCAIPKEDAKVFGMGGEQAGDVVYVLKPEYMAEHGYGFPTGESGCGSLKNVMVWRGPGVKQGFVYDRPRWLVDVVPTFCHATGNPVPADTEGAVMYQIFEKHDN